MKGFGIFNSDEKRFAVKKQMKFGRNLLSKYTKENRTSEKNTTRNRVSAALTDINRNRGVFTQTIEPH